MDSTITKIRHWFPFVTVCPVNSLPDLIYVTVEFSTFAELYSVRRRIKKEIRRNRKSYMETIAKRVLAELPKADAVTVTLLFGRHKTTIRRN